jgi:protein-L-isoaspartate(D-aspartate) O-methyltransferase
MQIFKLELLRFQVGKAGRAIGIDHIPELIELGTKNVKSDRPDLIRNGRVKLIRKLHFVDVSIINLILKPVVGDGRLGHEEEAPYNAIHVGAAAVEVPQAVSIINYKFSGNFL